MEWVASSLALYVGTRSVQSLDTPADLNGLVRFTERPNLVSVHVPSCFERAILNVFIRIMIYNRKMKLKIITLGQEIVAGLVQWYNIEYKLHRSIVMCVGL